MFVPDGQLPGAGYVGFDDDRPCPTVDLSTLVRLARLLGPAAHIGDLALGTVASLLAAIALVPLLRRRRDWAPVRPARPGTTDRSELR